MTHPSNSKTKHTAGKWESFDGSGGTMQSYSQSSGVLSADKKTLICGCFHDIKGGKEVASANAQFIVTAVNAHDALLSIAKELVSWDEDVDQLYTQNHPTLRRLTEQARTIILQVSERK